MIAGLVTAVFVLGVVALTASTRAQSSFERFALAILPLGGGLCGLLAAYLFRRTEPPDALFVNRTVLGALQRPVETEQLPASVIVASANVAAAAGVAPSPETFDVQRLDATRGYVLMADVGGKGLDAALDAAFVKHVVRALVRQAAAPDAMLSMLNAAYAEAHPRTESFASVFLGIVDARRATLVYASAAHAEAWLRHGLEAVSLPATGPAIGLSTNAHYAARSVAFAPADTLVLSTDTLTSVVAPEGERLTGEIAAAWIARAPADTIRGVVDDLVARAHRFAGGHARNDLMILALQNTSTGPGSG